MKEQEARSEKHEIETKTIYTKRLWSYPPTSPAWLFWCACVFSRILNLKSIPDAQTFVQRIVEGVTRLCQFFEQHPDARITVGFGPLQKHTIVLHIDTPPNALDKSLRYLHVLHEKIFTYFASMSWGCTHGWRMILSNPPPPLFFCL